MRAPAWARWLLARIVPRDRRDDVLGDLEEVHGRRRAERGTALAWFVSSLDALAVAGAFVVYRWREGESRLPWITASDLKLSLRLMRKQPLLAATAVAALAVGIALATLGFSVLDTALHGELPFPDGERFVQLRVMQLPEGYRTSLDLDRYHLLREAVDTLEHLGAVGGGQVTLTRASSSGELTVEPLEGAFVTPASFAYFSVVPRLGRGLVPADGAPGAPPVAVVSEDFWRRGLGGGPEVVGTTLSLGGVERTVVGVLPAGFEFPRRAAVWLPLDEQYLGGDAASGPRAGLRIFGVLRPGVSLAVAEEEITALARQWRAEHSPATETRLSVHAYTEPPEGVGLMGSVLVTVLVLVLLVIAGNVANLMLARTSSRTGELAVRSALGASRSRLIGQLTAEVLLLASVAAGLGLWAARRVLGLMDRLITEKPPWIDFAVSPRTVVFVVGITLLACLVGGVLPALRATRRDPALGMRSGRRADGGFAMGRLGKAMMIGELALSVGLLTGALVTAQGFMAYLDGHAGLPEGTVLTSKVVTAGVSDSGGAGAPGWPAAVTRAVEGLPGVAAAGAATRLPRQDPPTRRIHLAADRGGEREVATVPVVAVQPGFLEALDARLLAGRLFEEGDLTEHAPPVAIVNESFVARVLDGRNPLGRRIRTGAAGEPSGQPVWREIVGVVPDLGLSAADPERAAGVYLPMAEAPAPFFYLALRSEADPLQLAGPLRQALAGLHPELAVHEVQLLEQVNRDERAFLGGLATTLTAMGATALLLSLVGLYAILSFSVTRRTREIGIRVALGASRRQVLAMITRSAVVHLTWGALLGSAVAWFFVRAQDALLVTRLPTGQMWVLPVVVALLAVAGFLACQAPARRALGIEPSVALRAE